MSLDRIQSKFGLLQFSAEPVMGTTGTASTIGSNQYPGGFGFGPYAQIAAGTNSTNGGAFVVSPVPRGQATSDNQTFATTTGVISHENAAMVLISQTAAGYVLNLQQAASHGQLLTIVNANSFSGSIASTLNTTGFGATTTAACAVIDAAQTLGSNACAGFVALAQRGGTATTNVPFVWKRVF